MLLLTALLLWKHTSTPLALAYLEGVLVQPPKLIRPCYKSLKMHKTAPKINRTSKFQTPPPKFCLVTPLTIGPLESRLLLHWLFIWLKHNTGSFSKESSYISPRNYKAHTLFFVIVSFTSTHKRRWLGPPYCATYSTWAISLRLRYIDYCHQSRLAHL